MPCLARVAHTPRRTTPALRSIALLPSRARVVRVAPSRVLRQRAFPATRPVNARGIVKVAASADASLPAEPAAKSAYMHDFCLTIPYGFVVAAGGIVGGLVAGSMKSLMMGGGSGAILMVLGFLSLFGWKQGKSSTPITVVSLGLASMLTFVMGKRFLIAYKFMPAGLIMGMSGFMVLFYLYNMLSGGNPPNKNVKVAEDKTK